MGNNGFVEKNSWKYKRQNAEFWRGRFYSKNTGFDSNYKSKIRISSFKYTKKLVFERNWWTSTEDINSNYKMLESG